LDFKLLDITKCYQALEAEHDRLGCFAEFAKDMAFATGDDFMVQKLQLDMKLLQKRLTALVIGVQTDDFGEVLQSGTHSSDFVVIGRVLSYNIKMYAAHVS
jgi:hypothetical protein